MRALPLPSTGWLVVFCDPPPAKKTDPFTVRVLSAFMRSLFRRGYRHVFAMHPTVAGGTWIVIDPASTGLVVMEVDQSFFDALRLDVSMGNAAVVRAYVRTGGGVVPRGLFTCVGVVKHLLGIRAAHILTPAQLYKYLSRS